MYVPSSYLGKRTSSDRMKSMLRERVIWKQKLLFNEKGGSYLRCNYRIRLNRAEFFSI